MASCEDETEDLSTCSVCFNQYDNHERIPKFLPCSHTFCLQCLKRLFSSSQQSECPVCRTLTVITGGVETLPKNLFALHLILVSKNLKEINELSKKPRWCLTCGCLAKLICIKTHSTVNMCQDAEGMQRKMSESQDIMNETLEKRFAVQQHFEAVLLSLKEAELSARKQAEENNEQIVNLMSTLETVDKLRNGNEDVSDARGMIDTIFHQAEKHLQEAALLLAECCDQTEIRVWIDKIPATVKDTSESQFKPVNRIQRKVTETNQPLCSLEEKASVVTCSFSPKNPLLACGLDNGKWCLFKDENICSPFSDWATNIYGSPETTGSSVLCIDWDLSGSRIAIGFIGGIVEAWNKDGELIFSRKIHTDDVNEVLWNKKDVPSSDFFLTRSSDSSAAVCSAVLGTVVQTFPSSSTINQFVWIKEDCFATIYEDNRFTVYELGKENPIQVFDNDIDDSIFGLLLLDNNKLVTCTDYGSIQFWSLDCEESTQQLECDYPVYCIDLFEKKLTSVVEECGIKQIEESKQQLLAGGLENGTIQVWEVSSLSDPIKTIHKGHSKSVDKVMFSVDGTFLASMSFAVNELIIWCTKTWDKVHECKNATTKELVDSAISWTGNGMLAYAKGDRQVMVIEID